MDKTARWSIALSSAALILSICAFVAQYFWHSEGLVISVLNVDIDDKNLNTKLAFSNLGNRDEVIYDVFYAYEYEVKADRIYKDALVDTSFVVKAGESLIVNYSEIFHGIEHSKEYSVKELPINLFVRLLSKDDFAELKISSFDAETNLLHMRLPSVNVHDVTFDALGDYKKPSFTGYVSL
ncbi:hypothetical protein [Photobacterium sp. Alg240-V54]|uniref:hypothetical protein n=1 Tax=Photobacterium sp. Alg240-V54 TaxID=2305995 RepID=UPI0013D15CE9|nr:hypothetical protein [Photobacterium sp. Alg240-V54]